jgi:hypothetical protein
MSLMACAPPPTANCRAPSAATVNRTSYGFAFDFLLAASSARAPRRRFGIA